MPSDFQITYGEFLTPPPAVTSTLVVSFDIRGICSVLPVSFDIAEPVEKVKYGMGLTYGNGIRYGNNLNETSGRSSFLESVRSEIIEGSPRRILVPREPRGLRDEIFRSRTEHRLRFSWESVDESVTQRLQPFVSRTHELECECCLFGKDGVEYVTFYNAYKSHKNPIVLLGKFYRNVLATPIQPEGVEPNVFFQLPFSFLEEEFAELSGFEYRNRVLPALVRVHTRWTTFEEAGGTGQFLTWNIFDSENGIISFSQPLRDDDVVFVSAFIPTHLWAEADTLLRIVGVDTLSELEQALLELEGTLPRLRTFEEDKVIYDLDEGLVHVPLSFVKELNNQVQLEKSTLTSNDEDVQLQVRVTYTQDLSKFENPILRYNVYRETAQELPAVFVMSATETSFTEENLVGGVSLFFRVSAVSNDGLKEEGERSDTLQLDTVPDSPSNLRVKTFFNAIKLTWDRLEGNPNVIGYHVYRAVDDDDFVQVTTRPVVEEFYLDKDIEAGRRYRYRVTAVDKSSKYDRIAGDLVTSATYKQV